MFEARRFVGESARVRIPPSAAQTQAFVWCPSIRLRMVHVVQTGESGRGV